MKFKTEDGLFDVERYRAAARIYLTAQEILVDNAGYPSPTIAANSHKYRPLGLGFANLGALLMSMGLPYDSDEGRAVAGALMAIEHCEGYARSAEMASNPAVGTFDGYVDNAEPFMAVMRMHRDAVQQIDPSCPEYLQSWRPRRAPTGWSSWASSSATATPRRRCWPQRAPSAS